MNKPNSLRPKRSQLRQAKFSRLANISNPEFCNADPKATIYFTNAIAIGEDGWAMVAPIGDHPSLALTEQPDGKIKKQVAIQRITKASAEGMVTEFNNSRKGMRKFFRGLPIYVGHPDGPGMEKRYPDKEAKGIFAGLEVREDGLYGQPVFTNEGSALVDGQPPKFKAFSARLVDSEPDGDIGGKPVFTPTRIVSVGLTNHPQLPVHFFNSDDTLADTAEKPKTTHTMKKKLIALCALVGVQFTNESADDAAAEAALDEALAKVTGFANERSALTSKVSGLEGEKTTLAGKVTSLETEFANERQARIGELLAGAITSGRITGAEKPDWERRLGDKAQFANESAALGRLTPKVKTTSVTLKRGDREVQLDVSDTKARRQFLNEAAADLAIEAKLNPVRDAKRISALLHQRYPALFDNVPHVAIKMPGAKN